MNKNAAFIGSYATGTIHQMFDTAFLHVCAESFDHIDCYKDKTTFPYIEEMGKKYGFMQKVSLNPIKLIKASTRFSELFHFVKSAWLNITLYLRLKNDVIIYAYNNLFSLHIIHFMNKIFHKKIIICVHGELESLVNNEGGLFAKVNGIILRNYLLHKTIQKEIFFLVLGDSIFENLKRIIPPKNIHHFFSIDHPCYMNDLEKCGRMREDFNKFGLLGTLSAMKGFESFEYFVNRIKELSNDKYKISIIGRIDSHDHDAFLQEKGIDVTWSYLAREDFETRILECDCVLFFYPATSYKLIASGTILDAISLCRPVLAIKNDFFDYIINKSNYPAILCDNVDKMIEVIRSGSIKELNSNERTMKRDVFAPSQVALQLQEICQKIMS